MNLFQTHIATYGIALSIIAIVLVVDTNSRISKIQSEQQRRADFLRMVDEVLVLEFRASRCHEGYAWINDPYEAITTREPGKIQACMLVTAQSKQRALVGITPTADIAFFQWQDQEPITPPLPAPVHQPMRNANAAASPAPAENASAEEELLHAVSDRMIADGWVEDRAELLDTQDGLDHIEFTVDNEDEDFCLPDDRKLWPRIKDSIEENGYVVSVEDDKMIAER